MFDKKKKKNDIKNYEASSGNKKQVEKIGQSLNFAAAEAYKLLRTNLMFSISDEKACKVIGVTSALRGEGKSTTSMNVSYSLAEAGKKVLLIEADMRLPVIASAMEITRAPGLSHAIAGINEIPEAIHPSGIIENLDVIPAGEIPPNPSEMLSSKRMEKLVETLSEQYDYIIIDLPPVSVVSDSLAVARLLSGMVVVVRLNYCDKHALNDSIRQLQYTNVKILGFVLNDSESSAAHYKKYKSKFKKIYKYGYDYESRGKSKKGKKASSDSFDKA